MAARHKSVETKYMEERDALVRALPRLDRRTSSNCGRGRGRRAGEGPDATALVSVGQRRQRGAEQGAATAGSGQRTLHLRLHLGLPPVRRKLNQRFVRAIVKAVDDVNALDPQPDFVLFGGDLAQLGRPEELELGARSSKRSRRRSR